MSARKRLVFSGLVACLLVLAPLAAQTPLVVKSGTTSMGYSFGEDAQALGDWDGDGYGDIAVGIPALWLNATTSPGAVRILSGRDGSWLEVLWGTVHQERFGALLAAAGDVDADGFVDLAVASRPKQLGAPTRIQVFAGVTGDPLLEIPVEDLGLATMEGAGDVNADGHADIVKGGLCCTTSASFDQGKATVYSGADGAVLHSWCGDALADQFAVVAAGGDIDGDGFADVLVGAVEGDDFGPGPSGYVRALSGFDGHAFYTLDGEPAYNNGFGQVISPAGDVDRDGVQDFLLGIPQHKVGLSPAGAIQVRSGSDGSLVHQVEGQYVGMWFGVLAAGPGDVDGDGVPDFVAATFQFDASKWVGYEIYSGVDASLLQAVPVEPEALDHLLVMNAAGDMNADGTPDVLTVTHHEDAPMLRLFSGAPLLFEDLGHALQGSQGLPHLEIEGVLTQGVPLKLKVSNGLPLAPLALVVGTSQVLMPLHGGVLVPAPQLVVTGLPMNASGILLMMPTLTVGFPSGLELILQAWFKDATAPTGWAATNAVLGVAP